MRLVLVLIPWTHFTHVDSGCGRHCDWAFRLALATACAPGTRKQSGRAQGATIDGINWSRGLPSSMVRGPVRSVKVGFKLWEAREFSRFFCSADPLSPKHLWSSVADTANKQLSQVTVMRAMYPYFTRVSQNYTAPLVAFCGSMQLSTKEPVANNAHESWGQTWARATSRICCQH